MTIIDRAREFAIRAHGDQKRKYTGAAYWTHCEAVVAILHGAGIEDETTLAAAWLHDVCEDTTTTFCAISAAFGDDVGNLVEYLTDCTTNMGNRAARKRMDRERLSCAPAAAQTIKVADLIDNTSSIVEHDPKFAVTYMREKAMLLPLLKKADASLSWRAAEMLAAYEMKDLG